MNKLYAFIRHNSGICIGFALLPAILIYAYSCQSTVVSLVNSDQKITRAELVAEVDSILAAAEIKFDDLDRQDLVKNTIFNSLLDVAAGGSINPIGLLQMLGSIVGIGAVADNIRKRTLINTLKGDTLNAKVKEKVKEILVGKETNTSG